MPVNTQMKYQIGQLVYTATNIPGWFDYSIKNFIPANTPGTIIDFDPEDGRYLVKFYKEFGTYFIAESDLKLG